MKSQTENIMKQFDLDEYLANPSRKVVTRDGRNVRIICTERKSEEQPIVALIASLTEDSEYVGTYRKDGIWSTCGCSSELDLFFAPEKHEGWVNVYRDFDDVMCGSVFATEEDAKCKAKTAIATVKIEWEE